MAIAFDAKTNNITGSNNTSGGITISGSNRVLIATLNTSDSAATANLTGVPLTQLVKRSTIDGAYLYIFYLIAPATGAQTLNFVKTDAGSRGQGASYTGVKQTSFPESSNSGGTSLVGAGNFTVNLTISVTGCWAVASAENSLLDPDSAIVVTTDRGTAAGIKNGAIQDSGGTISTGTVAVGYHWPGTTTAEVVAVAFAPVPPPPTSGFFMAAAR